MSIRCPVCQGQRFIYELSCRDFTVSQERFDLLSCEGCGLWQTAPRPSQAEIGRYYASDAYISHSDKRQTLIDRLFHLVRRYTVRQKTRLVRSYLPVRGRLLDVGCGTGYFLAACRDQGLIVLGVEPNATARALAIQKQLPVLPSIEDALKADEPFDLLTLWHVLEHLHEPDVFIEQAYQLLKESGILIIALPNRCSYDAQYYQPYWAAYDVPRHLFHFTQRDIINLTKDRFSLEAVRPMYFDAFYVSMLSEKYRGRSLGFLRGLAVGLYSNLMAMRSGEYSSLIYILRRV